MAGEPALRTGVDIVEIARIEKSLSNPRFLARLFGASEGEQFAARGAKASFAAGNFCAKEAFSKALGTGVRGFALHEVEVLRDGLGAPYFVFSGEARRLVETGGLGFSVSISHCRAYAVATVVAYRQYGD